MKLKKINSDLTRDTFQHRNAKVIAPQQHTMTYTVMLMLTRRTKETT